MAMLRFVPPVSGVPSARRSDLPVFGLCAMAWVISVSAVADPVTGDRDGPGATREASKAVFDGTTHVSSAVAANLMAIALANRRASKTLLAKLAALDARHAPAPPPSDELRAILVDLYAHPPPEVPPAARQQAELQGDAAERAHFRHVALAEIADDFRARILEAAEDLLHEAMLASDLQMGRSRVEKAEVPAGGGGGSVPPQTADERPRQAKRAKSGPSSDHLERSKSASSGEPAEPKGPIRTGDSAVRLTPPAAAQPPPGPTAPPLPDPRPVVVPPPVPGPQDYADVDGLVQGSAAFSAPTTAPLKQTFAVYLRVAPEKLATLMANLKEEVPQPSTVVGRPDVRLAPRMWARVSGYGFDIDPKDAVFQAVSKVEPTTWVWQVTPTVAGDHSLLFELDGELEIGGKETPRRFYSAVQPVHIPINVVDVLSDKWEWIASTLVIPLLLWIWRSLQARRNPAIADRQAPPQRRRRAVGE
jgi:hypothetical protein